MDAITRTARQRAVMATIADLIVATAAGQTLRVAVGCDRRDETAFTDQLTEALHARGRPCHCLTTKLEPFRTGGYTRGHGDAGAPTVTVITSGTPDPDETDVCRINIRLCTSSRIIPPASTHPGADGPPRGSPADQEADIIVDYLDPGGASIRHLGPALTARPSSAGSQPDRKVRLP